MNLKDDFLETLEHTCSRRTAEVNTNRRLRASFQTAEIRPVKNTIAHSSEKTSKVGSAKLGPRLELSEGVHIGTHAVQYNVLGRIHVKPLSEIGVDFEKFNTRASRDASSFVGLLFERRQ